MYKIYCDYCYNHTTNYAKSEFVSRAVSDYTGIAQEEIQIEYEKSRKPVVLKPDGVYISVSHTRDYAVTAVSNRPIGVDVEQLRDYNPLILKKLCEEERTYIQNGGPERFFEVWCAKEAVLKLSGKGLSGGLSSFCVCENGKLLSETDGVMLAVSCTGNRCLAVATK